MRTTILLLAALTMGTCLARDVEYLHPGYPRIGNCYGGGLSWRKWEDSWEYWSKVDLFIGGGYDLHYDWDAPRWNEALLTMAANMVSMHQNNPNALVLPYVDVVEGPDNPNLPKEWWDLNEKGERWSGWPGMYRINTRLPEVLQYNLDMVRQHVFGNSMFDGVFYDCWSPDDWLCPRTAALLYGKAVVMLNAWNIPTTGFEHLNGVLSEDEINRVIDGRVDFDDFMTRYLAWSRNARKPVTTMIVCHPQAINDDPWRWSKLTHEERVAEMEKARLEDEQTMRFGLTATLMGDGYFGYDAGTMGRGNWWWYKEYDAPLQGPTGDCVRCPDGTYQREFHGGTVIVNGSAYDAVVQMDDRYLDVSTGRIATRFTIPMFDGRILLPTEKPLTRGQDVAPRVTATPPQQLRAARLDNNLTAVQTPGGLDLRLDGTGALRHILWQGEPLMTGGYPVVATPPFQAFSPADVTGGLQETAAGQPVKLVYRGTFVKDAQKADFAETVTVYPDSRFSVRFDCTAASDLNIRLWRHYFAFPVSAYAGATARSEEANSMLPAELDEEALMPAAKKLTIAAKHATVTVESTLPLGLVDHRKWGTDEYLLAGYPVSGEVKQGAQWSVEMTVTVAPADAK